MVASGTVLRTREENKERKRKKRRMQRKKRKIREEDEEGHPATIDGASDQPSELVRSSSIKDFASLPSE